MHHWLVWNIIYPLHERLKGHPTLRILKELEAAESLTASQLQELRMAKLRRFLAYGNDNVPYVRRILLDTGMQPDAFHEIRDLAKLPVMRKPEVRKYRSELRSRLAGKLGQYSTGGSTGEPLLYDLPKERVGAWTACRQRTMRWWGLSVGDKEYALWGAPVELTQQDRMRNLRDKLLRTKLVSAFDMSEAVMTRYLNLLEMSPCRTIFAYPSSIYLLCVQARKERRNLRRLGIKAVFVTGEVLFQHQRELIAETLNCPVASGYGGRDSGFISHECPQGGMHIMADATIVEILDASGQPVPTGEVGEIVVTDLYSREAPFLRYGTGDMGALSARQCPCGRPLPLLEKIEGRRTDFIVAPDGTILHALSAIYILREIEGIEQFRIRQTKVDRFRIQLVRNQNYRRESEEQIREGFRKRLRAPVEVSIEYLTTLPPEPSGKFRQVISEVPVKGDSTLATAAGPPEIVGTKN